MPLAFVGGMKEKRTDPWLIGFFSLICIMECGKQDKEEEEVPTPEKLKFLL